jgi:hypothetical protein
MLRAMRECKRYEAEQLTFRFSHIVKQVSLQAEEDNREGVAHAVQQEEHHAQDVQNDSRA